jgi:hypothetical protein
MTTKPTHSTRLARLASKDGDLTYAQALELVRRAKDQKRLPEILDADGMREALGILSRMKDEGFYKASPHLARILLGRAYDDAPFFIDAATLSTHTMILGSTGSGRSVAFQNFVAGMLDLGWSGTVLDTEGDTSQGGLLEFCRAASSERSMAFQQISAEGSSPVRLSPLAGLGAGEARDLILSLTPINDVYWQNIAKKLLTQVVNLCYDAFMPTLTKSCPTLYDIGTFLEQPGLVKATAHLLRERGVDPSLYAALLSLDDDAQKIAVGLGAAITMLYDTQVARCVLANAASTEKDAPEFNYDAPGLSYVGVDTTAHPDLSHLVGTSILAHAGASARTRLSMSPKVSPRFLAISGAASTDYSHLAALLSKARAGAISVVLTDQSPLSFEESSFSQLTQNINVMVMMAQQDQAGAERAAILLGESDTASELRQMRVGEAIIRVALPSPAITRVSISRLARPEKGSKIS